LKLIASQVLPQPAGGVDTGLNPPEPPLNIGHYHKFKWAPEIKCIAIIPDFEVPTAEARAVLPKQYSMKDITFNMQRVALLPTALGQSPPDPEMIYLAMQDKLHQQYRQKLIPGLTEILQSCTYKTHPGLLGICLSGAGPTILALATQNIETIATTLVQRFAEHNVKAEWKLLELAEEGTQVINHAEATAVRQPDDQEPFASLTYAGAGVSIDDGNSLVELIKPAVASTRRPGADGEIGGFGGLLGLKEAGYQEPPRIVIATDGIGTKLKVAFALDKHDTIGIDLVAMNVNDLVVQGAEPLAFVDYYATSKLNIHNAADFVRGVAEGCRQSNTALVGGETAEMPGLYQPGHYDAAGTAVGAIRLNQRILPDKDAMIEGDILLGLASNGLHSNGFSLIHAVLDRAGVQLTDPAPWKAGTTVGEELLIPTRIYVRPLLAAISKDLIKGMSHITGGGLLENIPRMLPSQLAARLYADRWETQPVFKWLKKSGQIEDIEFAKAWNTGIGFVLVVAAADEAEVTTILSDAGETVFSIGQLETRTAGGVVIEAMESWSR
jgi:homoserine kinase